MLPWMKGPAGKRRPTQIYEKQARCAATHKRDIDLHKKKQVNEAELTIKSMLNLLTRPSSAVGAGCATDLKQNLQPHLTKEGQKVP